jgi:hypothetical protein
MNAGADSNVLGAEEFRTFELDVERDDTSGVLLS